MNSPFRRCGIIHSTASTNRGRPHGESFYWLVTRRSILLVSTRTPSFHLSVRWQSNSTCRMGHQCVPLVRPRLILFYLSDSRALTESLRRKSCLIDRFFLFFFLFLFQFTFSRFLLLLSNHDFQLKIKENCLLKSENSYKFVNSWNLHYSICLINWAFILLNLKSIISHLSIISYDYGKHFIQ